MVDERRVEVYEQGQLEFLSGYVSGGTMMEYMGVEVEWSWSWSILDTGDLVYLRESVCMDGVPGRVSLDNRRLSSFLTP